MSCFIRRLTDQGLQPVDYHADNLAEAASHEPPDGIYTVASTFNTIQVLKLDAHLDRMEDSARRAGIDLQLDRQRLRSALRQMIIEAGYGNVRFRVTVPRDGDDFIISLEPFAGVPSALIEHGTRVMTAPGVYRHNAAAKTTDWMHERKRLQAAMPAGIYDTILCDDEGHMLEGLGSNFYAILDGQLRTAAAGVLPGIAQQIVFAVAPAIIPLRLEAPNLRDIPWISEAFITSSSRGIVSVVEIDGHALGVPGEITRQLRSAYEAWVVAHLQDL
jgi:branched-chain amino acid aminotransferase